MKIFLNILWIIIELALPAYSQVENKITGRFQDCTGNLSIKLYHIAEKKTLIDERKIICSKDTFQFRWNSTLEDSFENTYILDIEEKNMIITLVLTKYENINLKISPKKSNISFRNNIEITGSESAILYNQYNEWTFAVGDTIRNAIDSLEKLNVSPINIATKKHELIDNMLYRMEFYATQSNSPFLSSSALKAMITFVSLDGLETKYKEKIKKIALVVINKFPGNPTIQRTLLNSSVYLNFIKNN